MDDSLSPSNWISWQNVSTGQGGTFAPLSSPSFTAGDPLSGVPEGSNAYTNWTAINPITGQNQTGDAGNQKLNGWFNYLTGATPSTGTASAGANSAPTGTPQGGLLGGTDLASYFNRAVIIILGFIFVAVGLYLFGAGTPVKLIK